MLKRFSLLALLTLGFSAGWSQVSESDMLKAIESIGKGLEPDSLLDFDSIPPPDSVAATSTVVLGKYLKAYEGLYEYRKKSYEHRYSVFRWQLFSSKIVFFAVLFLLLSGIVFSGIQFRKGLQNDQLGTTSLEAMPGGIKVSSPVLGVIILIISLLFFYLYLVYIYPIHETF